MIATQPQVTIVVVPRDRFTSVIDCTRSILEHTDVPFKLVYLDFGYTKGELAQLWQMAAGVPLEVVPCGRAIPMLALKEHLPKIDTPYFAWVDNDTYMTPGWMTTLLDMAAQGARVILPVTMEREGLDVDRRKIPLRNHISHAELRSVTVDGKEYVFDYKPFRRASPEELPPDRHTVDFFELHTFFAETEVMRQLDLPAMVVREHIDLGIQLHRMGIDIWCDPKCQVHFDNIHERPSLRDLKFFFFRWDERLINQSHELFKQRWGYEFLNEQFMKNWAFRRKVYSVCRFLWLPQGVSDFTSRAFNKLFRPKLPARSAKDPLPESKRVLEERAVGTVAADA